MMLNREIIAKIDKRSPSVWLATWFGCGLLKPAPGTWGTLGALPFGVVLLCFGGWPLLLLAAVVMFFIGLFVAKRFDAMVGGHDSSAIVIDEVVGVWIALLPALLHTSFMVSAVYIFMAFSLFRLFDIIKHGPVGWADKKLSGAWGVMVDDVIAGIMAFIIILGVRVAGFG